MERLIAKYQIELEYPVLFKRSENDNLVYAVKIQGADVEVQLISDGFSKGKRKHEKLWTSMIDRVEIKISLPENEVPPPADRIPKGDHPSFYEIEQYFENHISKYNDIAKTIVQRLIIYFKYNLGTPFLSDRKRLNNLSLPTWFDENNKEIWKTINRAVYATYTPGKSKTEFGIKKFRKSDDKKLIEAIKNDVEIPLYQEILSDARTAILQKNYRRGILEMAIACEIAVKQTFFAESTISGLAYEYLENQGRVRIRTIDLISNVSEYVFGENFKSVNEQAWRNIDYLFRCRNKIAHRGEVMYRDDSGISHQPNMDTLRGWWNSIEEMLVWLSKKKRNL